MKSAPLLLLLAFLLAGCGGGGGSSVPPAQAPQRTDLLYGYYGDYLIQDTYDHVSFVWLNGWQGDLVNSAVAAKNSGVSHVVIGIDPKTSALEWRALFDRLLAAGVLDMVIAAAWDEPNLHATVGEVQHTVAMIRQVAAGYQELAGLKFWAVWADGSTKGMAPYFDALGHDSYGSGVVVVDLLPGQGLLLFPGCADPWREAPGPFVDYAMQHGEVVAIVPFIWRTPPGTPGVGLGCGDSDMRAAYRAAGCKITHRC